MPHYLGIDIGGSSVKVGVVGRTGEVRSARQSALTVDRGRDAGEEQIFREAEACLREAGLTAAHLGGVGIAAPGTMDPDAGVILQPFNLPGWENWPLRLQAERRFGRSTLLLNDANAAAYGECWVGAAKDVRSLMFWTLGTGIGGGIVLNGEILGGAHGHAGECGQMVIQADGGLPSPYGIHGSLELYAGARGLVRRCEHALAAGRSSRLRTLPAGQPLTPKEIADAAEAGDELALELILETARYIGIGTVNILHTLNPEVVLLGGSMTFGQHESPVGRAFLDRIRSTVRDRALPIPAARTVIDFARLGGSAGFIGAAGAAARAIASQPAS